MLIGRQILNQPLEDVLRFKKKKKSSSFQVSLNNCTDYGQDAK